MEHLTLALSILSPLIFLTFFVIYNKDLLKGSIKPNIVSWALFSLITLINAITYVVFTHDVLKSTLAFTDCFTCIVITCLILSKGQHSKLNKMEKIVILLSIASLILWYTLNSAVYANLLLQPAYILAFVPTLKNAWDKPQNESALVWLMWALSFVLTIAVVVIRRDGGFAQFINPSIALVLHAGVGLLALRKAR